MVDQFYGIKAIASNIGQQEGHYTEEMFAADFPQFFTSVGVCHVPQTVLAEFITLANRTIVPDKWRESWRYAAGLFVAHNSTLYLRSFGAGYSETPQEAAMAGQVIGTVKSATLGDASASYDDGSATSGTAEWGDLNLTLFGQQLANKAKLIGMGGSYVL